MGHARKQGLALTIWSKRWIVEYGIRTLAYGH